MLAATAVRPDVAIALAAAQSRAGREPLLVAQAVQNTDLVRVTAPRPRRDPAVLVLYLAHPLPPGVARRLLRGLRRHPDEEGITVLEAAAAGLTPDHLRQHLLGEDLSRRLRLVVEVVIMVIEGKEMVNIGETARGIVVHQEGGYRHPAGVTPLVDEGNEGSCVVYVGSLT